ncbi:3D domain-containing protein [Fundicoccus sp. Sow4_F4]|uniref:3D domain-containing protein n=1 Tax=Fundicoccus sp. Sow4_F4 TaxID=3438783 RepID=UPI003F8DD6BF
MKKSLKIAVAAISLSATMAPLSNLKVEAIEAAAFTLNAGSWRKRSLEDVQASVNEVVSLGNQTYIVQWGDTLGTIAAATGISVNDLAAINQISNPDLIISGSVIYFDAVNHTLTYTEPSGEEVTVAAEETNVAEVIEDTTIVEDTTVVEDGYLIDEIEEWDLGEAMNANQDESPAEEVVVDDSALEQALAEEEAARLAEEEAARLAEEEAAQLAEEEAARLTEEEAAQLAEEEAAQLAEEEAARLAEEEAARLAEEEAARLAEEEAAQLAEEEAARLAEEEAAQLTEEEAARLAEEEEAARLAEEEAARLAEEEAAQLTEEEAARLAEEEAARLAEEEAAQLTEEEAARLAEEEAARLAEEEAARLADEEAGRLAEEEAAQLAEEEAANSTDPTVYGTPIVVEATAYSRNEAGLGNFTADGTDLRLEPAVIAVDPSVIPLGTTVYIPGWGYYRAADTGGAIVGNKIDVHFENVADTYQFGRQSLTIYIVD